jgi:hypothetical protein
LLNSEIHRDNSRLKLTAYPWQQAPNLATLAEFFHLASNHFGWYSIGAPEKKPLFEKNF